MKLKVAVFLGVLGLFSSTTTATSFTPTRGYTVSTTTTNTHDEDCSNWKSEQGGSFQSLNYPENYPRNTDCITGLHADEGQVIRVYFQTIDIENSPSCKFDYLEVRDGDLPTSPLLGRFCGDVPPNFTSTGPNLWFKFHSGSSIQKGGFFAHYVAFEIADCYKSWSFNKGSFPITAKLAQREFRSQKECTTWCIEHPECQASVTSPTAWSYRECFLVSTSNIGFQKGWKTDLNTCFRQKNVELWSWQQVAGQLKVVSLGQAGVWGVNDDDDIYRSSYGRNGQYWQQFPGKLTDISVGRREIWGINRDDEIWIIKIGSLYIGWVQVPGVLRQISVSDQDHVWGINADDEIYRRTDNTWQHVYGRLKVVSVGQAGVWGVNTDDDIYYRTGTYGDANTQGSEWQHIGGKLKWVSVDRNIVFGVNAEGNIYYRAGITESAPAGTSWVRFPGRGLDQIDTYQSELWGINTQQQIWKLDMFYRAAVDLLIKNVYNGAGYLSVVGRDVKCINDEKKATRFVRNPALNKLVDAVSFKPSDSDLTLRHAGFILYADQTSTLLGSVVGQEDSCFKMKPGLSGVAGSVSLQSCNYPNKYMMFNSETKVEIKQPNGSAEEKAKASWTFSLPPG